MLISGGMETPSAPVGINEPSKANNRHCTCKHTHVPHHTCQFHTLCKCTQIWQHAPNTQPRNQHDRCLFSPGNACVVRQLDQQRPASAGHRQGWRRRWCEQPLSWRVAKVPTLHCEPPPLATRMGLPVRGFGPQTSGVFQPGEAGLARHVPTTPVQNSVRRPRSCLATTPQCLHPAHALWHAVHAARPFRD